MSNLPLSDGLIDVKAIQRASRLSLEAAASFFDSWAERFAKNKSLHRIANRPVLSVLNVKDFVTVYGLDGFRILLRLAKSRIHQRLGLDPYLIGVFDKADILNVELANQLPLDGTTGYALLPDWDGPPIQVYQELIEKRIQEWYVVQSHLTVPFFPVVCAGWDATVRGKHVPDFQLMRGFPWRPVVVNVTPQLFGHFLDEAMLFNKQCHVDLQIVFLHAWNEWTEASAIEPSDRYGMKLLHEVQIRSRRATLTTAPEGGNVEKNDSKTQSINEAFPSSLDS